MSETREDQLVALLGEAAQLVEQLEDILAPDLPRTDRRRVDLAREALRAYQEAAGHHAP